MDTMRERFTAVTSDLLDHDPEVAVVLADIGVERFVESGSLVRHPSRVINVGIREQLMVGVAGGMALEGMRPLIHSYASFVVERPFEQIKVDLGHQDVDAVIDSIGGSYDDAASGRTHQAPGDVAVMRSLPGWAIHVPGHPDEVEVLLRRAMAGGRHYLRLGAATNHEAGDFRTGRMHVARHIDGATATVIAVGPMLDRVLAATESHEVNVLSATTVRPFDGATLRRVMSGPNVVLVEPYLCGTSAAEVSEALVDVPHRLLSIGVPNVEHRHYGSWMEHDAAHGLDEAGIRRSIDAFIDRTNGSLVTWFGAIAL